MKLVSWNIQWGRGADGRVDLDRIVADARAFADFDVLCLQEVTSGHDRLPGCDGSDQFERLATLLPDHAAVFGVASDTPGPGGRRRRFGNMLLSRLPVRQVFNHLLPWPADGSVMSMQRVAVEATLDAAFGLVRVTTTHLEYYSAPQRNAQIERLRELHAEAVGQAHTQRPGTADDGAFEPIARGAPSVLVGDFNFRPDDPGRARLLQPIDNATPRYRDAWEVAHPDRPHDPTVGLHDKKQWADDPFTFDFAFVSDDLAGRVRDVRVDSRTAASDHQPILLDLA